MLDEQGVWKTCWCNEYCWFAVFWYPILGNNWDFDMFPIGCCIIVDDVKFCEGVCILLTNSVLVADTNSLQLPILDIGVDVIELSELGKFIADECWWQYCGGQNDGNVSWRGCSWGGGFVAWIHIVDRDWFCSTKVCGT